MPRAAKDLDVALGLSRDPETFIEQQVRRERVLRMQSDRLRLRPAC
jgi:hypothetical protein